MIRTYHSKRGAVTIDTDNFTDEELSWLDGMTRKKIAEDVARQPKDPAIELAELKARLKAKGII